MGKHQETMKKKGARSLESQEIMLLQNAETEKEKANIVSRKMVWSERKSLVVENFDRIP